ncbi:MAG: threonine--tRNA ligase [Candidatus Shikimatogenerans bostrichidophilus]|nr:MAG: threonine--tRNA ligase [Candidatus Shikimatogenerans bostrichidophilus]
MVKKIINHKVIGRKLNLFFFYKNYNSSMPIWLSNGVFILNKIIKIINKYNIKNKYEEIKTPIFGNYILYKKSKHIEKYKNNMFRLFIKKKTYLKPMNCPYHCFVYKNLNNISYRTMPKRFYEFGTVYRKEKSGEINGLFRMNTFTQDDGHIFCSNSKQTIKEIKKIIKIILKIYKKFKIKKYKIRLSLKDKNFKQYIGRKKNWKKSEAILYKIKKIIEKKYKKKVVIKYGEAAFYGPKIDFIIKDTYNREWQLSTIQIDYNMPKKFKLKYITKKNKEKTPIMIHRAYLGSIERFIAILIEHKKGKLPIWLIKTQLVILPVTYKNYNYCKKILCKLLKLKIRAIIDKKKENLNKKIKIYEKKKIPFICIVGDKEEKEKTIYIRNKKKKIKKINVFKYILNYINKS